ncbi:MAG: universal stress protein [Chloroflexia bacterium]|nr:universal stress protein [Chloroflexia bacterium]
MEELLKLIDDLEIHLLKRGIEFSSNLYLAKDFPQKVIETSVVDDADLIVITANLDYDLKAFFMGPFSQQIVNHSHRPVLSIRATMIEEVNKIFLTNRVLIGKVNSSDSLFEKL